MLPFRKLFVQVCNFEVRNSLIESVQKAVGLLRNFIDESEDPVFSQVIISQTRGFFSRNFNFQASSLKDFFAVSGIFILRVFFYCK